MTNKIIQISFLCVQNGNLMTCAPTKICKTNSISAMKPSQTLSGLLKIIGSGKII